MIGVRRRVLRGVGTVVAFCTAVGCGAQSGDAGEADDRHSRTVSVGVSSTQAAVDVAALKSGTAADALDGRLGSATSLTDAQRQALAEGDDVVIPEGQLDYLADLAEELDRDGGLAAFDAFGGRDTELKTQLADGMQILSNPRVRTGKAPPAASLSGSGRAANSPTRHRSGGLDALPPSWSEPLTDSPMMLGSKTAAMPGVAGLTKSTTKLTKLSTIDDLGTISGVLGHGTDKARMGTDIDRALIARAADIAGATNDPDVLYTSPDGPYEIERSEIGATLNSMLDVAGQDEIAVHDAMMTGREGGPSAISAMPETFSAPGVKPTFGSVDFEAGAYDANSSKTNLLAFDWDEEAGHDSGMRGMLGGLGDPDTAIGEAGDPGPEATRAGEAAGELARIIADNKDVLVNVESHGNDSMGQLNPGVSEAAADAVGPHLIDLAGGDASAIGIDGARQLDGQGQMSDLFTVLNMHPDSATSINTHGADVVSYLQQKVGENAEFLPDGRVKATLEAEEVGRISLGMKWGFHEAASELDRGMRREVATEYYLNGVQYDAGKSVVSKAVGMNPGGGVLAAGRDVIRPYVKSAPVRENSYTGKLSGDEFEELMDAVEFTVETARPRSSASYENLLNGFVKKHPELRDGALAPYVGDDGTVTVPSEDISNFVSAADDALGGVDDEFATGVELARHNKGWR